MRAAALALATLSLVACNNVIIGNGQARSVPLRFRGSPPDATVTIDDQRAGSLDMVASRGVRVLPGKHRISIEAPGYLPYDTVVDAKDAVVIVEAKLAPVPD